MIVLYQCRFVHCNKCTTLLRGVDSGRYCKCVGMGMWELSALWCEPKTAFRNKFYLKSDHLIFH